ncbi:MAG: ABC transporter permease [Gemmatimonadota bacterium]|nr:ABC transporter permease [Gemmatimonadota bacterium]
MRLTVREALLSFVRAPVLSVLAVTTIGFALFVLGLFGLVALNLRDTLTEIAERVEVVVYLTRGTPVEVATVAIGDIQAFPEVESAIYVTEEQALERARQQLTEFRGVFTDLETNPLPASLEVRLLPEYRDAPNVQAVAERLRGFRFVEDVRFGGEWVEKLDRLRRLAGVVGLVIGIGFAAAATIIIGTTIRMTVLARTREIQIMRLVGATDGFIRRPFLLDGAIKGALGGVLAILLNYAAYLAVSRGLFEAAFFTAGQASLFVALGILLGLGASLVSVGRHLPQA